MLRRDDLAVVRRLGLVAVSVVFVFSGLFVARASEEQQVQPTRAAAEIRLVPGDRLRILCPGGRLTGTVDLAICQPAPTATITATSTASATTTSSPTVTVSPTASPTATPTATQTASPTETSTPAASATSAPSATEDHSGHMTATPAGPTPTAVAGQRCPSVMHDPTRWHPAVDPATGCYYGHEHGDPPPSWLTAAGYTVSFDHDHNTGAAETELKDASFKGYYLAYTSVTDRSSTLIDWAAYAVACDDATGRPRPGITLPYGVVQHCGYSRQTTDEPVRMYVVAHGQALPTERASVFHSIQYWVHYRGVVSHWRGWYDMGLPYAESADCRTTGDRQVRQGGGLPPNPILGGPGSPSDPGAEQWYVRAGGPGGYADCQPGGVFAPAYPDPANPGQWLMETNPARWFRPASGWVPDFGITFNQAQTFVDINNDRARPFDRASWKITGRTPQTRRVEIVWGVGGRGALMPSGNVWVTALGQVVPSNTDPRCSQAVYAYPDHPQGGRAFNPVPFFLPGCSRAYIDPALADAMRQNRVRFEFNTNISLHPVETIGVDPLTP